MFDQLSGKMSGVLEGLSKNGKLSEGDVTEAMREVRLAMLEADVALPVVRDFVNKVRERAVGHEVLESVSPGQAVAKIVNDALIDALGGAGAVPLNLSAVPPVPVLMVGLQGSGKTTTSGKIALRLSQREGKKVLLASLDVYRPAAQLQLQQLAERVNAITKKVTALPIVAGQSPVEIAKRALDTGRREGYDIVILDTAGRLSIDEALMDEVRQIRAVTTPAETLLVVDAMTGQDAVNTAKSFNEAVGITGVVMSRMDGDARGGAALSMKAITGAPIKLTGSGEKLEALEEFHPERVAGRILGLGDVAGLVERAAETLDHEEGERVAKKMLAGKFDLDDYVSQINQINRMGSISGILGMLPGMGKIKDMLGDKEIDTSIFKRHKAIISSMTKQERKTPGIIKASRKKRIASGSGTTVQEVNRLLKQFDDMSTMMKRISKMGLGGLMRGMGGAGGLADMMKGMGKPGGRPPFA
ncbi:signal recognition particle GTPase FFH/SRP54 [Gluconobacter thailandicus F149-1 = NBRC 100600]|uniref:Signal recognition particle protein n=1 Tax=Gluconobacter thailandicus NBRC 3257 TaxID=1381097 RepID=A0ABQ0ISQ0_GLUTH|nr:signal recognition particle protein [Gluconobacter thailandicus]AFW01842.1 signal recognition particle protein [Gluconobacter oxydans H24]ANQ42566.1 signal recognition particle protein [Gluconobacter oxydans]KXV53401.1 RNA-binding protein [Gluconobacter thailandicus]GAC88315.1 signal recognition particle protein [Gluconobacter thailandicus NBRC 3255]GAD25238.1 signal recognition particle protein [Gluconobacter thailandicus NBRC 3257]